MLKYSLILLCSAATVVGCGSDDTTGPDADYVDTFTNGLSRAGEHFKVSIVEATPAPPDKGENAWTLVLTDAADAPIDDATINIRPFMPAHGHGSTPETSPAVSAGADGKYTIEKFVLIMPGRWTLDLEIKGANGTEETIQFAFEVEG